MAEHSTAGARPTGLRGLLARYRSRPADEVRTVAGLSAAAVVALLAVVRVGINAPLGESIAGFQSIHAVAAPVAVLATALAAIAVGTVANTDWALVGLVAAGGFSLLALFGPAAEVPAAGVLPVAALLATAPAIAATDRTRGRRALFAGLVAVGVTASLGASTGLLGPELRSAGTVAALLALAVAPATSGVSQTALLAGVLAALALVAAAVLAPFAAGAALLAVGAAVDPTLAVAAVAVGGGVAVIVDGAIRRRWPAFAGGLLLLAAGVPASVPRALAVVLGAHLLVVAPVSSSIENGGEPA